MHIYIIYTYVPQDHQRREGECVHMYILNIFKYMCTHTHTKAERGRGRGRDRERERERECI